MTTKNVVPPEAETVGVGSYSGVTQMTFASVKNAKEWKKIWDQTHAHEAPPPPMPTVNFRKDMVLVVFLGQRSDGGYAIKITRLQKVNLKVSTMVVNWAVTRSEGATSLALSSPYHMVIVPRTRRVHFQPEPAKAA